MNAAFRHISVAQLIDDDEALEPLYSVEIPQHDRKAKREVSKEKRAFECRPVRRQRVAEEEAEND